MLELEIKPRDSKESAETLRAKGVLPAVIYGPKEESAAITVEQKTFERLFKQAGETTIIKLKGLGEEKDSLVHDIQRHPVTDTILHADFYVLEKGKKLTLNIPLEFVGEAPAEKLGHIVTKVVHEVEIEVAPAELPQHLEVDISKLENVGDHILASDIKLPASAELKINPEEVIVSVSAFVEEKIEAPAPTEAAPAEGAAPAAEGGEKKE
jgi:large subunit ribosomal protein L25